MISLKNEVRAALESTGEAVWFFYPQSWVRLPAIAWRESVNRELAQADGREHLAELEYTIDIWSDSGAENMRIAALINARMAALRFKRSFSQDLYESATGYHHRVVRYRCVADTAGNIYQ